MIGGNLKEYILEINKYNKWKLSENQMSRDIFFNLSVFAKLS